MSRVFRGQAGLTLIETMAALFIFSAVTLGVTPMLIGSMKGSAKARSYTVGKNLAVQAMERVRGLPFFESVKGVVNPPRRDVLDLYFPDMGTGYANGKFTTTCTRTSSSPPASGPSACPMKLQDGTSAIPIGYTIRFEAEFVQPGSITNGTQNFAVVSPTNYNWSSLSTEKPPAQLLRISVIASWSIGGAARTFTLASLIGERSPSPDKVRGTANLEFAVQSSTSYLGDDGKVTTLTATAGDSQSDIETRSVSAADHQTRAARLTVAEEEFNGVPGSVLQDLLGASSAVHAPTDIWYAADVSGTAQTATYRTSPTASYTQVASVGTTSASNVGARVFNELPAAEGLFTFTGTDPVYWVDNQASTGSRAELLLHATRNVLQVRKATLGMSGSTKVETTPLTPVGSRKVESTVNAKVGRVDLFPTTFINQEQFAVIVMRDFQVDLKCTSTASPTTATVTGTWTAKLKYWTDPGNNGRTTDGAYSTEMTIGGSVGGGTEVLESIQIANPLVYDSSDNTKDVYLFAANGLKGYLQDWSMKPQILWSEDAAGRATSASIEGALQLITSPTNPAISASALNVTLGNASCQAVDKR